MTAAERLRGLPGAGARVLGSSLLLPGLILLAAALRVALWRSGHPLHHDEALYGSWARLIASGRDPLLLSSWVDKPPLALYAQAAALRMFGPTEMALRLPGMVASILAVPLLYGLARCAYGRATALIATALLATCGFAIQFSPTTFTDPWLVLFMLAACWAALAGRSFLAGLAVGLALASKQQGLLVAPLAIALLAMSHAQRERRFRLLPFIAHALLPALFGFGLIFAPVTFWDSLRWEKRPSYWDRSLATYGGLQLARIELWPHRIAGWSGPMRYLFGPPAVTVVVAAFAALGAATSLRRGERQGTTIDRILAAYGVGFLALHVGITFQPWDRYLLPLAPVVALLGARGVALTLTPRPVGAVHPWPDPPALSRPDRAGGTGELPLRLRSETGWVIGAVFLVAMAWGAMAGAMGRLPVGSDHGAYAGVDALAARLRELPPGDMLYYRSLGWHYDFYLFDAPQERRWWGSAWKLADDAAKSASSEPARGQWVVLPPPDAVASDDLRLALGTRALSLVESRRLAMADGRIAWLYRILPASAP